MNTNALRYNSHQFFHWAAGPGIVNFAVPFLLSRGLTASQAGAVMAVGGLLSCFSQPFMAAAVDRRGKQTLPWLTGGLAGLCAGGFLLLTAGSTGPLLAGLVFLACYWAFDAAVPLLNSLGVAHSTPAQPINFGVARGVGSLASALCVLVLGHALELWGYGALTWLMAGLSVVVVAHCCTYPRRTETLPHTPKKENTSCSVPVFFGRYRWYCLSLVSILLFAASQAMADNYMLPILERLGGGSSQAGTALSIASFSAIPVMFLFSRVRARLGDKGVLALMAFSYLAKAVVFFAASSVAVVYAAQFFQMTTYALLAPEQVFYARSRVSGADMVKGQAFITAAFTLGCALGNFAGGWLMEQFGIPSLLKAMVVFAGLGAANLLFTAGKKDSGI